MRLENMNDSQLQRLMMSKRLTLVSADMTCDEQIMHVLEETKPDAITTGLSIDDEWTHITVADQLSAHAVYARREGIPLYAFGPVIPIEIAVDANLFETDYDTITSKVDESGLTQQERYALLDHNYCVAQGIKHQFYECGRQNIVHIDDCVWYEGRQALQDEVLAGRVELIVLGDEQPEFETQLLH